MFCLRLKNFMFAYEKDEERNDFYTIKNKTKDWALVQTAAFALEI